MGSVAVRAIAQNCRCMRVIQVVLIDCITAKESDIGHSKEESFVFMEPVHDTSYRQLVLARKGHSARKHTHANTECTTEQPLSRMHYE